jgi:hypothetical protein
VEFWTHTPSALNRFGANEGFLRISMDATKIYDRIPVQRTAEEQYPLLGPVVVNDVQSGRARNAGEEPKHRTRTVSGSPLW